MILASGVALDLDGAARCQPRAGDPGGKGDSYSARRGDNPLHLSWTRIGTLLVIYVVWTPEEGIRQQLPVSRNGMV
jgi:hypothetical protein